LKSRIRQSPLRLPIFDGLDRRVRIAGYKQRATHTEVEMLMLTRRPHQSVRIGDDILVTVLGFQGDRVRLGIQAPRSIAVDREEIHKRNRAEKALSLDPPPRPSDGS
jgi:carbon storage regulator